MNQKKVATVAVLIGAAAIAVWFVKSLKNDTTPVRAVTKTDTGGLVTTPVQTDRLAFITSPIRAALSLFLENVGKVRDFALGALPNSSNRRTPYNNAASAQAAANAPVRPDYRAKILP